MQFLKKVGQFVCFHDYRLQLEKDRVFLLCWKCKKETEGWNLGKEVIKVGILSGVAVVGLLCAWHLGFRPRPGSGIQPSKEKQG